MDKGDANNMYNEGEEGNYEIYEQNYGYENKGVGDEYYYGNGGQQKYDKYGKEGVNQDDYVVQVDQGTQMSQGIQMKKTQSRGDESLPQKNVLISEKKDIFDLDNPPSRNRSRTIYGFHSSFQGRKAAPPKLNNNKYQYQNNLSQNPLIAHPKINNPLPKSSLAPSKTTRCPHCNHVLNVDPKSIQGNSQKPNIAPNNQRSYKNFKKDSFQSKTIESQRSYKAIKTEPNSNQREERRLREQKEREEKKLRDKKDLEERLKRQREERDKKFREEKEKKEREKREQKEKQQREFQKLMEQKEKERKEKRDKDQQQRNLRSQGNQPPQRKEYKYVDQTKNSEYYQRKTITKNVIENPAVPKNYYINEKGVVVIVPPKSVKTSVTKIVTVNKPVNTIYSNDGRTFGKSNNMGFYQSQGVETKVIIKPYRK